MTEKLPGSWSVAPLSELAEINPGIDKARFQDSDEVPFVPMLAVEAGTGRMDVSGRRPFAEVKSGFTPFASGDVLFAKITPCMENGKMAVVPDLPHGVGFGSTEFSVLRPTAAIDAKLLYYFVSSAAFRQEAQHHMTGAVGQKRVPKRYLETKLFPLPPINEQRRIVEKIETLFAELDKGEEYLRQVQTLLARYRQSVLKAAVTGELTADCRAQRAGQLEHGRDLLARILKARREKWQGRGRYVEPAEPDTRNLPKLPDGWVWSSLGQLIVTIEAGKNVRCEERPPRAAEVGIVKVSAVTWGEFDELQSKTITDPSYVSPSLRIQEGDLLISRANTLELVGASVVVGPVQRHLQLSDKVLRLRCAYPLEHWLNITLRSALGRAQIQAFATGAQLSMRNISQENMQRIAVPLPPPEEINLLVAKTALLQAQEKEMLSVVLDTMKRSGVLRQTILKDAFSGRLVPQDPNDEPAAELLARIRAQRAMESRKTARRMATA